MAKLIGLWSRPPPGPPSKNAATEETIGEKSKPMEDCESRYLKRKRRAATETAKGTTETVKSTKTIKGTGKSSKVSRVRKTARVEKPGKLFPNLDGACDEHWVLGPNMSANDVIRTYVGYHDHTI
jgi:hypothetical protein